MHFQFVVAAPTAAIPMPPPPPAGDGHAALLREMIDVQKEQLAYARASHESQNMSTRWQAFLTRWGEEFPEVGKGCLESMPQIERAFLRLLDDMTRRLADEDSGHCDSLLGEFWTDTAFAWSSWSVLMCSALTGSSSNHGSNAG